MRTYLRVGIPFSLAMAATFGHGTVITFDGLTGNTWDEVTHYQESGFDFQPTFGAWYEDHGIGNSTPSLAACRLFNPDDQPPIYSFMLVKRIGGGKFKLKSADVMKDYDARAAAEFSGWTNSSFVYSNAYYIDQPNTFESFVNPNADDLVDYAYIELFPMSFGVVTMNLDNVVLETESVPEPTTMALIALGGVATARRRRTL